MSLSIEMNPDHIVLGFTLSNMEVYDTEAQEVIDSGTIITFGFLLFNINILI